MLTAQGVVEMDSVQRAILVLLQGRQGFNVRLDEVVDRVGSMTGQPSSVIEEKINYLASEGVINMQTDGPWQVLSAPTGMMQ